MQRVGGSVMIDRVKSVGGRLLLRYASVVEMTYEEVLKMGGTGKALTRCRLHIRHSSHGKISSDEGDTCSSFCRGWIVACGEPMLVLQLPA